jgi:hypothetical protein
MRKYVSIVLVLFAVGVLSGCDLAARQLLAQFRMSIEPEEVTVPAGTSEIVTVTISPFTGISLSPVTVRLVNAPAGVSAPEFTAFQGGQRNWEISVASTVTPRTYELEAHGVSQGMAVVPPQQTVKFNLIVPDPNEEGSNSGEN